MISFTEYCFCFWVVVFFFWKGGIWFFLELLKGEKEGRDLNNNNTNTNININTNTNTNTNTHRRIREKEEEKKKKKRKTYEAYSATSTQVPRHISYSLLEPLHNPP